MSEEFGRRVTADNVRFLVENKLRPLGVIAPPDGAEAPELRRADPMLALAFRAAVIPERVVRGVATLFAPLFFPAVVVAALAGLVALDAWLFFVHGVAESARQTIYQPVLIVGIFALVVISAVFHEIGHAAAARYGGARPGAMGAGIYMVWPVLYTDVTDAYRLSRRGRLRTDLGGVYFNALFMLGAFGAYFATGFEPLLLVVALQHVQVLYQFLPFLRLDGYYVVSDLTGVPDIMSRIKPTLRSLIPGREPDPRVKELKPWARRAVVAYALLFVPLFALLMAALAANAPRVFATAWDSFFVHFDHVSASFGSGKTLAGIAGIVQMSALTLPALGIALTGFRSVRHLARKAWTWSHDNVARRVAVVASGAAAVGVLVFLWWPDGDYRPIQPQEKGTIQGAVYQLASFHTGRPGLTEERAEELGGAPTARELGSTRLGSTGAADDDVVVIERSTPSSNLAIAINRRDGGSIFALAFSITSVMNGVVDQTNAAVAFANCQDCRTVAIAIQIILVMSDPHIVAPTNTATAVNYSCAVCVTFAAAYQVIFGIGVPIGFTEEGQQARGARRRQLLALGDGDL